MKALDEAGNIAVSAELKISEGIAINSKWNNANRVNRPELTEGMIPVKWNGTNWVTTTAEDEEWYNYKESGTSNESKWANVMLSDGTYKYDTVEAGTVVQETELGSMFVWIPRYAYKIESGYHSSTAGEMSIEFLEGTSSHKTGVNIGSYPEYSYSETASESKMLNYIVHPAFNYDETQLTGLWIAKFVASREDATSSNAGSSEKIKIMSNKYYWLAQPGKAYKFSVQMNEEGNNYKLNSKDNIVDPHLMKNTEWGAMAYLTYSKYGTNKTQVNQNSTYVAGSNYASSQNCASTKNIYGIYDLNMYRYSEYVAAYLNNRKETLTTYASELLTAPNKHKDIYSVGKKGNTILSDTSKDNYEANRNMYGDAIYEISDYPSSNVGTWLKESTRMAYMGNEIFTRGRGVLSYGMHNGSYTYTFRPVIAVKNENSGENIEITADVTTPRNTTFTGDNNGVPAGPITVTINYGETSLQKQYKEGATGEWITVTDNIKQIQVTENKTIYARYYEESKGTVANSYKAKSYTIANVDNASPKDFVSFNNYIEGMGIEIAGSTTDNLTKKVRYEYYLDGSVIETTQNPYYILNNLDTSISHTTYMRALDEAGNATARTKEIEINKYIASNPKWNSKNKVNQPELTEGMIPIKWNGTNWVTTTADDEDWYNYKESGTSNESKWANVMLSDGTYKYDTVETGTVVQESELGSMFVWIPRYAYKIESGYHSNIAGEISIEFIEGTGLHKVGVNLGEYPEYSYSETASESKMLNYVIHPAFNYDGVQLTGLWIAKFKASRADATASNVGTSNKIKIVGNKRLLSTQIGDSYTVSTEMNTEGNSYLLNSEDSIVDPHLMKNKEWGAITYLAHSKFGRNNTQIYSNNNAIMAGNNYINTASCGTTNNIYGIYDISNTVESVAAYIDNSNTNLTKEIVNAPNKHKEVYQVGKTGDIQAENYERSRDRYGDAIYETSNNNTWFNYGRNFPYLNYPMFTRSGFGLSYNTASARLAFRPVIVVMSSVENISITADVTTPRNTTFTGNNNGVPAGPITVTIDYGNTSLQKQYKIGTAGEWVTIKDNSIQIQVTNNDTIYARYWDNSSESEVKGNKARSYTIANVDNTKPKTFTAVTNYVEGSGIEISGYTTDDITDKVTYQYYLDENLIGTSKEKNYISNIDTTRSHTTYMKALDEAGNAVQSEKVQISVGITKNPKWNSTNKVNQPELTEGMIPVKWNGENWVTTTAEDEEWYDYKESGTNNESKWANVMLSDGTYKYDTVEAGTVVQEEELGSMFVWLPRYAYKIESGYHSNTEGEISIEFLEGTSSHKTEVNIGSYPEYSYSTTASESKMLNYVVHPAFNYDETQLTGLWIAKFKASRADATSSSKGTSEEIKIVANKYIYGAWTDKNLSKVYELTIAMNNEGNSYNLNIKDNLVDPHLMKNSEWGALVYLVQSKYGRNMKVLKQTYGNRTYNVGNQYITNVDDASTQNIYGVYDLVMYYFPETTSAIDDVDNKLVAPNKHKDMYINRYGDAVYETSSLEPGTSSNTASWYGGIADMQKNGSGIIYLRGYNGSSMFSYKSQPIDRNIASFRPVIAVMN